MKFAALSVVCLSGLLLVGCQSAREWTYRIDGPPREQDEAASIHVTVIGSVPLDGIKSSLTTKFAIDDKTALDEVIPSTLAEEEQLRRAYRVEGRVALPTISSSTTTTSEQTGLDEAVTSVNSTETRASGDASSLTSPNTLAGSQTAPPGQLTARDFKRDPMLMRQSAAQLKRGIALLDRIVQDAPIPDNYTAHVITFQVSLLPYHRNMPVDAYSTISVFSGDNTGLLIPTNFMHGLSLTNNRIVVGPDPFAGLGMSAGGAMQPAFYRQSVEPRTSDAHTDTPNESDQSKSQADQYSHATKALSAFNKAQTDVINLLQISGDAWLRNTNWLALDTDKLSREIGKAVVTKLEPSDKTPPEKLDAIRAVIDGGAKDITAAFYKKLSGDRHGLSGLKNPIVLPLLVTDTLEASSVSRAASVSEALALAISGQLKGIGFGGTAERINEEISRMLGYDLNSLLTVGQVSPNTFRVRFGAMNQASGRWAMVPRTHNVYMLLLVPNESINPALEKNVMRFTAKTELHNITTGHVLTPRSASSIACSIKSVLKSYKAETAFKSVDDRELLFNFIQRNDYAGFAGLLREKDDGVHNRIHQYADQIWADLTTVWNGSQFSQSKFVVSKLSAAEWPGAGKANTDITFVDDGKAMKVLLKGGKNLNQANLIAILEVSATQGGKSNKLVLPASAIQVLPGSTMAIASFPSLQDKYKDLSFSLHTMNPTGDFSASSPSAYLYVKKDSGDDRSEPSLQVPASIIRFNADGVATVGVEIDGISQTETQKLYRLVVRGSDAKLLMTQPEKIMKGMDIVGNGSATLELSNVSQLAPVTFQIQEKKSSSFVGSPTVRLAEALPAKSDSD